MNLSHKSWPKREVLCQLRESSIQLPPIPIGPAGLIAAMLRTQGLLLPITAFQPPHIFRSWLFSDVSSPEARDLSYDHSRVILSRSFKDSICPMLQLPPELQRCVAVAWSSPQPPNRLSWTSKIRVFVCQDKRESWWIVIECITTHQNPRIMSILTALTNITKQIDFTNLHKLYHSPFASILLSCPTFGWHLAFGRRWRSSFKAESNERRWDLRIWTSLVSASKII